MTACYVCMCSTYAFVSSLFEQLNVQLCEYIAPICIRSFTNGNGHNAYADVTAKRTQTALDRVVGRCDFNCASGDSLVMMPVRRILPMHTENVRNSNVQTSNDGSG